MELAMQQPPNASPGPKTLPFDAELFPFFARPAEVTPLVYRVLSDARRDEDEARHLATITREQLDPEFDRWRSALEAGAERPEPVTVESGLAAIRRNPTALREAAHFAAALFRPMHTLEAVLPPGVTILAPRYDRVWTSLNGTSWVSGYTGYEKPAEHPLFTGLVAVPAVGTSYNLQGLGMYVTVTAPSLVAITPMGTYQSKISGLLGAPSLRGTAGLGALVYEGTSATPLISRIVEVWRVAGLGPRESVSVEGPIKDAAPPAFGFGPIPLANPLLAWMQPGVTYTIWFWCWIRTGITANEYTLGGISMNLPFVVVSAGPPPIIR
jgi:hypothetical protein